MPSLKDLPVNQKIGYESAGNVTLVLNGTADGLILTGTLNGRNIATDGSSLDAAVAKLAGVEANATADQTSGEIVAAVNAALANTRWQQGPQSLDGTIIARPSNTKHAPLTNDNAARGAALALALAAFAAGTDETLELADGFTYQLASPLTVSLTGKRQLIGRATLQAASGTDFNYCLKMTAAPAAEIVGTWNIDHKGTANVRTSGTGDTLYLAGDGRIDWAYARIADGPAKPGDPAGDGSLVRTEGLGEKRLIFCDLVDPAYACIRFLATNTILVDTAARIVNYKAGTKARYLYSDAQAAQTDIESIQWLGGIWDARDAGAFERNANFDAWSGLGDYYRIRRVVIDRVKMLHGTNHTNTSGDSFIKFDNVDHWIVSNCLERHSNPATVATGVNGRETVITVGTCYSGKIINCDFDGAIKGAGEAPSPSIATPLTDTNRFFCGELLIDNTTLGANAENEHAIQNAAWFDRIIWRDPRVKCNLIGSGAGGLRSVINNVSTGTRLQQEIRVEGTAFVATNWADNYGAFVRNVAHLGAFACDDIVMTDAGNPTVLSLSVATRLAATARPADPWTFYLGRNPILARGIAPLNTTGTYADDHLTPSEAVTPTTDCFPSLTALNTLGRPCRIQNINPGPHGNGHAAAWFYGSAAKFLEHPALEF